MTAILTIFLGFTLIFSACEKDSMLIVKSGLNQDFTLVVDQMGIITSFNSNENRIDTIRMTFKGLVGEDSRCPSNVDCVWSGIAKVEFDIHTKNDDISILLSTIPAPINPSSNISGVINSRLDTLGFTFNLIDLSPYPKKNKDINPSKYKATIKITQ